MKKIIIVLGITSFIVAGMLVFALMNKNKPASIDQQISTTTPFSTFPESEEIIPGEPIENVENNKEETNEVIETESFLQHESVKKEPSVDGYYYLGNTFLPNDDQVAPNYVITYEETNKFFNITLLEEPLRQSRFEAESYLRSLLKISDVEMCGLEYTLSTPDYVNEEMSGNDFRFSFCEDAMVL